MKITADFTKITGKIKPMHGVGQPPILGISDRWMHYLKEAHIPYSRLHDMGGPYGGFRFVDIPNIFRDFDADENDPASYDFTFTDWLIKTLMAYDCEPFFRLGVTIENSWNMKAYRIYPPKDAAKWARICEHIIRHYNEGWAGGFTFGIKYWEIWNEPEGDCDENGPFNKGAMWIGTQADYFNLYETTAKHLKACFGDSIRVGGYASCGFYAIKDDPDCEGIENPVTGRQYWIKYAHDFLKFVKKTGSPLDFFSWHNYVQPDVAFEMEDYCARLLAKYGFDDVEDICNEWNPTPDCKLRSTPMAAARVLATMLGMQKKKIGMLNFYDARIGTSQYGGMFNPDTWEPYLTYYTFMMFGDLYVLENEVETSCDEDMLKIGGAAKDGRAVLLIANNNANAVTAELSLTGVNAENADILMIDAEHRYTPTGKKATGKLTIPAYGCVEIKFS